MTEKHRWKTILQYMAGLFALGLTLAAAMFLPGVYTAWQDERIMDSVTLSNREAISFLDADSIDIAGRLKMLLEAENINFGEADYYTEMPAEDVWQKTERLLQKWCDAGLLPEVIMQWVQSADVTDSEWGVLFYSVYVDQTVIPVTIWRCYVASRYGDMVTIVMDMEKDILYYVSVSGEDVMDEMALELGYDSGAAPDYAAVCGALEAEILDTGNVIERDVILKFEDFDSYAYRRLMSSEYGFGYAVMYGTHWWSDMMSLLSETYGFVEYECTADEFLAQTDSTVQEEYDSKEKNGKDTDLMQF